jgi:hypothetical protein
VSPTSESCLLRSLAVQGATRVSNVHKAIMLINNQWRRPPQGSPIPHASGQPDRASPVVPATGDCGLLQGEQHTCSSVLPTSQGRRETAGRQDCRRYRGKVRQRVCADSGQVEFAEGVSLESGFDPILLARYLYHEMIRNWIYEIELTWLDSHHCPSRTPLVGSHRMPTFMTLSSLPRIWRRWTGWTREPRVPAAGTPLRLLELVGWTVSKELDESFAILSMQNRRIIRTRVSTCIFDTFVW